jgi:hypothetical protein
MSNTNISIKVSDKAGVVIRERNEDLKSSSKAKDKQDEHSRKVHNKIVRQV